MELTACGCSQEGRQRWLHQIAFVSGHSWTPVLPVFNHSTYYRGSQTTTSGLTTELTTILLAYLVIIKSTKNILDN